MKNMIKRIIVGVAVGLILALLSGCDVVHAQSGSITLPNAMYYLDGNQNKISLSFGGSFSGYGKGEVILSYAIPYGQFYTNTPTGVTINAQNGINYTCVITSSGISDIGNYNLFSVRCPVDFSNTGINYIHIFYHYTQSSTTQREFIMINKYITFVEENNDNTNIVNALNSINNAITNQTNYLRGQLSIFQSQFGIIDGHITDISGLIQNANVVINQQLQEQQETNDKLQETNDFLKDTSTPSSSDYDFDSYNEDNGVITNLLTMPITLIQGMLNGMNNNCSSYNLGSIKGQNISLPCIYPGQHLGIAWNIIDVIMSGIFIFIFGKKCITIFNDVTNMKSNQVDEVFK